MRTYNQTGRDLAGWGRGALDRNTGPSPANTPLCGLEQTRVHPGSMTQGRQLELRISNVVVWGHLHTCPWAGGQGQGGAALSVSYFGVPWGFSLENNNPCKPLNQPPRASICPDPGPRKSRWSVKFLNE